jgi:hypothetical protein
MKDNVTFLVLLFFLSLLIFKIPIGQLNSKDILGIWQGEMQKGRIMEFIFSKNNKCKVSNLNVKNEYFHAKCNINTKKDIATLTISEISSGLGSLYTIIKFINPDTIKIAKFSQRWRTMPITFNKNTDMVLYKK